MRILFIADWRSPIARSWIAYFASRDQWDVHVLSLFPCQHYSLPGVTVHTIEVWGSRHARASSSTTVRTTGPLRRYVANAWTGIGMPLASLRAASAARALTERLRPDLVHALRLPPEGHVAALVNRTPLVVSIWGNDLTLWSRRYFMHRSLTRLVLRRTSALIADCHRDISLAKEFGWRQNRPEAVIPGAGGIRLEELDRDRLAARRKLRIDEKAIIITNPRGLRSYVRTDLFLAAAADVLKENKQAVVVATGLAGDKATERAVAAMAHANRVRLLDTLPREELLDLLAATDVMVSPTEHDGTPNTLLEGMALGAFPVLADSAPAREWITDGENGYLFSIHSKDSLVARLNSACRATPLRRHAASKNERLIATRATYTTEMAKAERLYYSLVDVEQPEIAGELQFRTQVSK
jgi:glycosyltransferase involved in cell wall biosynthesis